MTNKSFNSGVEKEEMAEKLDSNALPDPPVMRITVIGMRRRNSSKRPDGHEPQGSVWLMVAERSGQTILASASQIFMRGRQALGGNVQIE